MNLNVSTINKLSGMLDKVQTENESTGDRIELVKLLDITAPEELESFVHKHGFESVAKLKQYLTKRDDDAIVRGLIIVGAAVLTAYLLSRGFVYKPLSV